MAGQHDPAKLEKLETVSTARRQLVGQAIIDGVLNPSDAALVSLADSDYNQGTGNYTQKGGDHKQSGPGDYNQSSSISRGDPFINVVRGQGVLRE
jgi:hypothetical protein